MLETLLATSVTIGLEALIGARVIAGAAWSWLAGQPLWLVATLLLSIKGAALVLIGAARSWRRQRARLHAARQRAAEVRASRRQTPGAASTATTAPVREGGTVRARELVHQGFPAIDVARRTGLSRDAISLLLAQTPGSARKGRPAAAGLSAPGAAPRPKPGEGLRAQL